MKVEGESGVILKNVDKSEYVSLVLNETFNAKGGGDEGVFVKEGKLHVYEKGWFDMG